MNDNRMGFKRTLLLSLGALAGVLAMDRAIHVIRQSQTTSAKR